MVDGKGKMVDGMVDSKGGVAVNHFEHF